MTIQKIVVEKWQNSNRYRVFVKRTVTIGGQPWIQELNYDLSGMDEVRKTIKELCKIDDKGKK